jgi:zinc protease
MVLVAWPTDDNREIKRTRRLNILAAILEDRLRTTIREQLGATYSPEAFNSGSRIYQGYGYLLAQSVVEPGKEKPILDLMVKLGRDLSLNGVSKDELLRARDPVMTSLRESVQTNDYWLQSVLTLSSRYPQQLDWPTTILSDYSAINVQEMNSLAKKYLNPRDAATIIVQPVSNWRLKKWKMDTTQVGIR